MATPRSSHCCRPRRLRRGGAIAVAVLGVFDALATAGPAAAFKVGIHEDITEEILRGRGFDNDSADEVGDSNYYTDIFEPTNAAAHADNNQLGAASQRLRDKINTIRQSLQACKRRPALDALGEALHTVQDVYSHSNSIDNGIAIPDILNMSNGSAPCDATRNFAPGGLVTGYFSLSGFLAGKISRPPNPRGQCLGMPANTCCHFDLNKDEDAAGVPNRARHGAAVGAARTATGNYLDLVEQDIRSKIGGGTAEQLIKMLKKKQRTVMFVIDDTGSMGNDIAGVKASVNTILNQLLASDEAPTLGLVTFKDNVTNRGLTCDLEALRAQINALFASGGGDCPEAMNSALLSAIATFPTGRSDIQLPGGRIVLATDASARDAGLGPTVQAQAAARGINIDAILTGDCTAEDGFTFDAGDPEAGLSANGDEAGEETAEGDGSTNSHTGDPLTSPSARTLLRALTEQTGGVLFNVSRVEVDDVVPTLVELSSPQSALILSRRLDLVAGSPMTVEIPVDETFTERVTFMVTASTSGGLPAVTLQRPNGGVVQPTDPDTVRRQLSSVVTFAMTAPATGTWRVTVAGGSRVVVRAFGSTPLRVDGLRLLTEELLSNRPEIDLVPIDGQPVAGAALALDLRLTEPPTDAFLFLRRLDGSVLDQEPLTLTAGERRFRANVTVPSEPFVLVVE
ncbi:MAG: vWA domain-containing protein, partial [Candidatus Rokuibacteriota bacterium]